MKLLLSDIRRALARRESYALIERQNPSRSSRHTVGWVKDDHKLKYELKSFHPADRSQGGRTLTGQMYLDAWGWEGPISYQRREHTGTHEEATPAYIHEKVLQESFRWGANLMEFYPAFPR